MTADASARGTSPASRVEDLPLLPALQLGGTATVTDVARAMTATDVPAVFVHVGDAWVIVTERDIVAALAAGVAPSAAAFDIGTSHPTMVTSDVTVLDALVLMLQRGVRSVPVLGPGAELHGLLTLSVVLEALLSGVEIPVWLTGLRTALHLHVRA